MESSPGTARQVFYSREERSESCMPTYEELVELARVCARNARNTTTPAVAAELWKMAKEYQRLAAERDNVGWPDIGEPPSPMKFE